MNIISEIQATDIASELSIESLFDRIDIYKEISSRIRTLYDKHLHWAFAQTTP